MIVSHTCKMLRIAIPWLGMLLMSSTAGAREKCVAPAGTSLVEFRSGQNLLRGFIDIPDRKGRHPVVAIVHGTGYTDVTVGNRYYEPMRKALRAAGIAILIWDKPGNGCSEGKYSSVFPIRERATETLAAVEVLKHRPDIDPTRIGLWALSQGGWVAPMAAVRSRDIAFLIIVSGPGRDAISQTIHASINKLRSSGVSAADAAQAHKTLKRALTMASAGASADEFSAAVAGLRKYRVLNDTQILDETTAGYMSAAQYVPEWTLSAATLLEEIEQPTLAIFGEQDVLVDWRESKDIYREAFARSGNRDLLIRSFSNADHDLLRTDQPSGIAERELVEGYLQLLIEWLGERRFLGVRQ